MATLAASAPQRATHLKQLPGIVVGADVPKSQLLGRYAFYSLPDEERSGAKFMRSWVKHGLDPDTLPDARQPVDVFRSACASVKARVAKDPKTGQRIEILANEVVPDGTAYQITIRRWDVRNRVIEHEKAMRMEFDKRTNTINAAHLDDFDPAMGRLITQIQDHFDANAKTIPGQKVRNAIRQTILDIGGTNLRRKAGGLYFIPATSPDGTDTEPILEGLAGVLKDLYGDRADFHVLRAGNDASEREMIAKHFALNANEKARELSQKTWTRVRTGKGERGVRSDLIANLQNERRVLMAQVRHFEQLVNFERADIEESLRELDEGLDKLEELANGGEPAFALTPAGQKAAKRATT